MRVQRVVSLDPPPHRCRPGSEALSTPWFADWRPHTDAIRNSAVKSPSCANSSPPLTENLALPGVEHTNRPSSTCPSVGVANYRPGRPHAGGGRDWQAVGTKWLLRAP